MQFILKGIPLVVGILLTILLPYLLDGKTHEYARDSTLIIHKREEDRNPHDSLDWVLRWRDLFIAFFTAIFVLQFAAAEEITSTSQKLAFIPLPFNWHLSDVALIFTIIVVPVCLVFAFYLSSKVTSTYVETTEKLKTKIAYWLKFSLFVMPFYIISFLFVYST